MIRSLSPEGAPRARRARGTFVAPEDGISILLVEGINHQTIAQNVCNAIANQINAARSKGISHILMAIPPPAHLVIARGKEIDLKANENGQVILQLRGTPREGNIILPGEW